MTKSRGIGRGRPRVPDERKVKFETLNCRVESGIADQFRAACAAKNTTPNAEIKRWVLDFLKIDAGDK